MTDVIIVGAGPAGLSAAIVCAENGLKVKVIDEFPKPGGRLLGQLHQEPNGQWWNGIEEAKIIVGKAMSLGVDIEVGVSVYDIKQTEQGWKVYSANMITEVPYLLLATGAAETALPIPGWTLPGVMSIGAAQVMSNVHRIKVGHRGIVIGINVLSAAITQELHWAGIDIAAMVLPGKSIVTKGMSDPLQVMNSMQRVAHLAPSAWIRFGAKLAGSSWLQRLGVRLYPKSGIKLRGIPIQMRKAAVEILGSSQVEGVRLADVTPDGEIIPGTETDKQVDFVCVSGGLYPLAELAAVAGCRFNYIPELGGHIPMHNQKMQTPLKGLFVAGNITGIESAKVAGAQGTVAGLSICLTSGKDKVQDQLDKAVKHVEAVRKQALIQFHPGVVSGRENLEAQWRLNIQ